MFKIKYIIICVVMCFVLIFSVGFAAWIITDNFVGSLDGSINAEDARGEEFVTISDATEYLRYTNDGFMYHYVYITVDEETQKVKTYYNKITVDVTVDVNKWKTLFNDSVDSIYVELTLELADLPSELIDYNIIDCVSSSCDDGVNVTNDSNNIIGYEIDLTNLSTTTTDGVTTYDDVTFSVTYSFDVSSINKFLFSDQYSILHYDGNMFNINSTISIQSN